MADPRPRKPLPPGRLLIRSYADPIFRIVNFANAPGTSHPGDASQTSERPRQGYRLPCRGLLAGRVGRYQNPNGIDPVLVIDRLCHCNRPTLSSNLGCNHG
jgi:hypothetical protein